MSTTQKYNPEFKEQALKLASELSPVEAAKQLNIPVNTIYGWQRVIRQNTLLAENSSGDPTSAEEMAALRKQLKQQEKEIARLQKEKEFLEEASAFFAASRLKSAKTKE